MSDIKLLKNGLNFKIADQTAYFNYFWLRDNCPSVWDEDTQERVFDILNEPDDLCVTDAHLSDSQLNLVWSDGHQSSFDLAWLERWHSGENHADIAVRSRRAWYGDHYDKLQRFDYVDLIENPAEVANWAEALLDEGIALVHGLPDSNFGLSSLCELIGTVRASFSGYAFDVQSKVKPENLAYTAKALELHTDLPAEELAPGLQFLHCRANDATGGDSLFVDAVAVANEFKDKYPDFFKVLCETKTPFRYTTVDHDVRARQHIIELDPENGEVSGISYSQHMADTFDLKQEELDVFYPAFRKFGQMMLEDKYLMNFRLHAGECVVFDNHRVAHGRASFDDGSGFRYLRGCYIDRGELRSRYRVLRAKHSK